MARTPVSLVPPAVFLALLLGTGMWAWSVGLEGPYLFDDFTTPLDDPASESLAAWCQNLSVTLRPLTKLTYAAEVDSGVAVDPAARRVVSLLLLAASAAILSGLIFRLADGIGAYGSALFGALWFAHPVHADATLLLSGRSAIVAIAFLLAALLAMERSRAWVAALLFGLACLSRETALAGLLPLAVLAASQPGRSHRAALRELAPSLLAGALTLCWIVTTRRYVHLAEFSMLGRPFWSSFISQVAAVPVGLGLLLRPLELSVDYGVPLPTRPDAPLFLFGIALYVAAVTGVLVFVTRSRAAAVGLALWLAALLPTQSFVPKLDALTNRPLSLALAGLLLAVAPLVGASIRLLHERYPAAARASLIPSAMLACGVMLFAATTVATAQRADLFRSDLTLWRDAATKSSANVRPHLQYAVLLKRAGRDRDALSVVNAARQIDPLNSQVAMMARVFRSGDLPQ